MSKRSKLRTRLLSRPIDFTFRELSTLMGQLGYREGNKGRTSGSRVIFHHSITDHVILLHKPHPGNILKRYQIDYLIEQLKKTGSI